MEKNSSMVDSMLESNAPNKYGGTFMESVLTTDRAGYDIGDHGLREKQDRPEYNFFWGKWRCSGLRWILPFILVVSFTLDVLALNMIFVTVQLVGFDA